MSRELLFAAFFFAVFLFLLHELYLFLAPFTIPLVWAAILALTFYPATAWLIRAFRGRRSLAAAALVLLVTVAAILPSLWLGSLLVSQATAAYSYVQEAVQRGEPQRMLAGLKASRLGSLWGWIAPFADKVSIDPADIVLRATNWISDQMVAQATNLARNALVSLGNFVLMLVSLFFFFRDGESMAARLRELLPMEPEYKDRVFRRLYDTTTAVVQSMIVTALAQGVLAGIGYAVAGLHFSLFLGFLTGLASFLPLAGPALVWGGASIYLFLTGHNAAAIGLALWGGLVVSMVDNPIKSLLIGGQAKLPTFLLLFSILGGVSAYGFLGVFVGPVILAILFSFVEIYGEEYQGAMLPPE